MKKIKRLQLSNLDANESAFFSRELEHVKRASYDVEYPELKARRLIPMSAEPAPSGAESITYYQFNRTGMARMISDYASDLPRVDVLGLKFTSPVRALGAAYGYNIQEIRASAMAKRSLPSMRAVAAREVMAEQEDAILALGDSATGIPGFLTAASVPQASVATVAGATTWAQKLAADPDLIADDITDAIADMAAATFGREYPDTFICPEAQFALISTTRLVDQNMTVLQFLKQAFPRITTWEPWYRLTGAGSGVTDRFMLYKKSNTKCGAEVPQEFESLDPQAKGLEFEVPCHSRVGGVVFYYPLSATYRDGI